MQKVDVLIIGASAAGLMCSIEAGKRQRKVVVLDQANKPGRKILMSGGGRCNFTNYDIQADNYLSHNPHFCKSALKRFTQWDFINLVQQYEIPYHEREHGQLFCDDSARNILDMLLEESRKVNVDIQLKTEISGVHQQAEQHFIVSTNRGDWHCQSVVIATGGLSIPSMGSSPFGYEIAKQFGMNVWPTRAGLVPFTLQPNDKEKLSHLSGIAVDSIVSNTRQSFRENILFTHRGLSGPAILQISSYWQPGEEITINLLPELDLLGKLSEEQQSRSKQKLKTLLSQFLPKRLISSLLDDTITDHPLQAVSHHQLRQIAQNLQQWTIKPNGTEGYRTAEVTLGGIDCNGLSSKTMQSNSVEGLYFIGEVVDVTGWLGGYNFQWAWSSGWCAGQYV